MNTTHTSPSNILATIKQNPGSVLTGVGSILLAAVIGFGNYSAKAGGQEAKAADIERRVSMLENSTATRREVESLANSFAQYKVEWREQMKTMEDIERSNEAILNQEIRYMRRDAPTKP